MAEVSPSTGRVVCVGGLLLDRRVRSAAPVVHGTSNPASSAVRRGGVAANVAHVLAGLGVAVDLVSAVGDDAAGRFLVEAAERAGVGVSGVRVVAGAETAEYLAVLEPGGELFVAAAVTDVLGAIEPDDVRAAWPPDGGRVFAETNLPAVTLTATLELARTTRVSLAVDAVSVAKAARLPHELAGIDVLFCNLDEARALTRTDAAPADAAAVLRDRGAGGVVVTLGRGGALVLDGGEPVHVPAAPVAVRDVTGAGDTLIAATLAAQTRGVGLVEGVRGAVAAAGRAIGG